jgi:DNA repair protein RadD
MKTLRPEQRKAIDAIYDAFRNGMERPLVVLPTGAGKSVVLAALVKETLEHWPDERILVLVHVQELVEQDWLELVEMWPDAPASIYCAGLGEKDLSGQVVFASIQSIAKRAFDLQKVDLIIVDECHLIPAGESGRYNKLFKDLATINGGPRPIIGLTATDYRTDSGSLTEGRGKIFDAVAYRVELADLIAQGRLVVPRALRTATEIDVTGVKTTAGEFNLGQLQAAADRDELTRAAVGEIIEAGKDRRSWLVFSTGVDHAHHIRDEIRARGYSCETVTGDTPKGQRKAIIAAFKAGAIRCMTNDSCLTTGFNHPATDLVAVLRPTKSPGLWVQMCGRGLRTAPGKADCVVLDFGRNTQRHGPLDMIKAVAKGAVGVPPVKVCPECQAEIFAGLTQCPHCGFEFEMERERSKHDTKPDLAPLLGSVVSDWLPVTRVDYRRHVKPGSPDTLRVDYWCGMTRYSEWVCFDHEPESYPRKKAERWWRHRSDLPCPDSVGESLDVIDECKGNIEAVRVRRDGKFWRIVAVKEMQ